MLTALKCGHQHSGTGGASKLGAGVHTYRVLRVGLKASHHGGPWSCQNLIGRIVTAEGGGVAHVHGYIVQIRETNMLVILPGTMKIKLIVFKECNGYDIKNLPYQVLRLILMPTFSTHIWTILITTNHINNGHMVDS